MKLAKALLFVSAWLLAVFGASHWGDQPSLLIEDTTDNFAVNAAADDSMCDMYFRRQDAPAPRVHSRDRIDWRERDHRTLA